MQAQAAAPAGIDPAALEAAHKLSIRNRAACLRSTQLGCFLCLKTFAPSKVVEWIDKDETAMCPFCGTDAVLPDAERPFDAAFLAAMRQRWFNTDNEEEVCKPTMTEEQAEEEEEEGDERPSQAPGAKP